MSAKCHKRTSAASLDHLVGALQKRFWNCKAKCFGGFDIDHKLKLRRVLHWQFGRLGSAQYAVDISCPLLKLAYRIEAVRNQAPRLGIKSQRIKRWQAQAGGQCDDEV